MKTFELWLKLARKLQLFQNELKSKGHLRSGKPLKRGQQSLEGSFIANEEYVYYIK